MTFVEALEALQQGKSIRRSGWKPTESVVRRMGALRYDRTPHRRWSWTTDDLDATDWEARPA